MLTSALNLPRRLLWRARISRWNIGYPDPELRHLSGLCNASKISVDVGASLGLYTSHLLGHSAEVWAFEPRRSAAAELERHFSGSPVRVHTVALSDADGETTITICGSDLGRSTLEKSNPVPGEEEVVTTRRLDSFDLRDVGFIKIDVEGHEGAVLRGAFAFGGRTVLGRGRRRRSHACSEKRATRAGFCWEMSGAPSPRSTPRNTSASARLRTSTTSSSCPPSAGTL